MLVAIVFALLIPMVLAFHQPRAFAAINGTLDLVVVAREMPAIFNFPRMGLDAKVWAYHTCRRTHVEQMDCPLLAYWPYGTLLQLEPGERLKLRLVNKLPGKRTNIHYHGLIVNAGYANNFTTFGDYSYVTSYNSQYEPEVESVEFPMVLKRDYIDYDFEIPTTHIKGLNWFHTHNMQHASGPIPNDFNMDMLNYGLSGALSIGNLKQYVTNIENTPQNTLLLRTTFFDANRTLLSSPLPSFCNHTDPLPGYCLGVGQYEGAIEYFSVTGQVFPQLEVGVKGAIWRLVHAMSNTALQISIVDSETNLPIPFQVLWVDGASVLSVSSHFVESFFFMPGSRVDIYVPPLALVTKAYLLGSGPTHGSNEEDLYPNVWFASVTFFNEKLQQQRPVVSSSGLATDHKENVVRTDLSCGAIPPLPVGHRRRITFAVDEFIPIIFKLGYAELDANGQVVNGTEIPPQVFDPQQLPICADLGTTEVWELDNISDDDHNFHIHQTKFKVLNTTDIRPGYSITREHEVDSVPMKAFTKTLVEIPFVESGDIMVHCHIGFHSDHGMMMRVRVAARNSNETEAADEIVQDEVVDDDDVADKVEDNNVDEIGEVFEDVADKVEDNNVDEIGEVFEDVVDILDTLPEEIVKEVPDDVIKEVIEEVKQDNTTTVESIEQVVTDHVKRRKRGGKKKNT